MIEEYHWVIEKHFGHIVFSWTSGDSDSYYPSYNWIVESADNPVVYVKYDDDVADFGERTPFYDGITEGSEMPFLEELRESVEYFADWEQFYDYARSNFHDDANFLNEVLVTRAKMEEFYKNVSYRN
jgi:hypothetical protein